jgi:hypothetical protein
MCDLSLPLPTRTAARATTTIHGTARPYQVVPGGTISHTVPTVALHTGARPCPTSSSLGVGAREEGSLESLLILVLIGVVVELARLRERRRRACPPSRTCAQHQPMTPGGPGTGAPSWRALAGHPCSPWPSTRRARVQVHVRLCRHRKVFLEVVLHRCRCGSCGGRRQHGHSQWSHRREHWQRRTQRRAEVTRRAQRRTAEQREDAHGKNSRRRSRRGLLRL